MAAITTPDELREMQERSRDRGSLLVVFVWADFHEPSKEGGQLDQLVSQLSVVHPDCDFVKVCCQSVRRGKDKLDGGEGGRHHVKWDACLADGGRGQARSASRASLYVYCTYSG